MADIFNTYENEDCKQHFSINKTNRHIEITGITIDKNLGVKSHVFFFGCIKKNKVTSVSFVPNAVDPESGALFRTIALGDIELQLDDYDSAMTLYDYLKRWYLE